MNDLISRQAAITEIHKSVFEFFDICDGDEESPMTLKDKQLLEINKAISTRIKNLPSVQPEKICVAKVTMTDEQVKEAFENAKMEILALHPDVKKGKWIETNIKGLDYVYCSECQDTYYPVPLDEAWNYCPHCGADMRGEEDDS